LLQSAQSQTTAPHTTHYPLVQLTRFHFNHRWKHLIHLCYLCGLLQGVNADDLAQFAFVMHVSVSLVQGF
ncbi:hypothetical protein, partial [Limosilactobacillus vaginalis]|uniref:hypothetical protein n=1 Tax=Limosilactobacillus vaginalis TaxID=1633 RepID=UPI001F1B4FAA